MEERFEFISNRVSSRYYSPKTKLDIITFATGNPVNKIDAKLSANNQHLLGFDVARLLTKRHNLELQRCSQHYSLASIFNETTTKDKHSVKQKNMKKIYSTTRKHIIRLFICY